MPRVKGRDPAFTKAIIRESGVSRLRDLVDEPGVPWLALRTTDVIAEANGRLQSAEPGSPKLTSGAVGNAFGGQEGLRQRMLIAAVAGSVELSAQGQGLLAAVEHGDVSAEDAIDVLGRADLANMVDQPTNTRLWLLMLAGSADPAMRRTAVEAYAEFDLALVPHYQRIAEAQCRQLIDGWTFEDIAGAFTSAVEGAAIRLIVDPDRRTALERTLLIQRRAVWHAALTAA